MPGLCSPSLDHNTLCKAYADGAVVPVEVIDEVYRRIAATDDHPASFTRLPLRALLAMASSVEAMSMLAVAARSMAA